MKLSGDFDARCLRPRQQRSWRARFALLLSLLLWLAGLLALGTGASSLIGSHAELDAPVGVGLSLLLAGALLIAGALLLRRRSRLRQQRAGDLSLAPHLLRR